MESVQRSVHRLHIGLLGEFEVWLLMLVYVRALYNNCFIIPTSAQY